MHAFPSSRHLHSRHIISHLLFSSVLLLGLLSLPKTALALGASPGILEFQDLLQKNEYQRTVIISSTEQDPISSIILSVEGPDAAEIRLSRNKITLGNGRTADPLVITLLPNARLGAHQAALRVSPVLTNQKIKPGESSAKPEIVVPISWTVTDTPKKEATLLNASVYTQSSSTVWTIHGLLKNTGNTPLRVISLKTTSRKKTQEKTLPKPIILKPFESTEFSATTERTSLPSGEYPIDIILLDEKNEPVLKTSLRGTVPRGSITETRSPWWHSVVSFFRSLFSAS